MDVGTVMLLTPVAMRRSAMACWLVEGRGSTSVVLAEVVEADVQPACHHITPRDNRQEQYDITNTE